MEIKTLLAASGNYGGSRAASQIKYICIHYTGVDGDTAKNEATAFNTHVVEASAHYFVDDNEVWQSVPDLRVAWAVGDRRYDDYIKTGGAKMYGIVTNTNSLSIELCGTMRDGTMRSTVKTQTLAAKLAAELMKKYSIPLANVYRHFDVSGKHCPAYMMDAAEWEKFKSRIEAEYMDAETFKKHMDEYLNNLAKQSPDAWSKNERAFVEKIGLIKGDGKSMKYKAFPTREEIATMFYRFAQWIDKI